MLQRQPNCAELRSMDFFIQILCRFQKCKQKFSPSLFSNEKSPSRNNFNSIPILGLHYLQSDSIFDTRAKLLIIKHATLVCNY